MRVSFRAYGSLNEIQFEVVEGSVPNFVSFGNYCDVWNQLNYKIIMNNNSVRTGLKIETKLSSYISVTDYGSVYD